MMKKPTAKKSPAKKPSKSGHRSLKTAKPHRSAKPAKKAKAAKTPKAAKPAKVAKKAPTKKRVTTAHHKLSRFGRRPATTICTTDTTFVDLSHDPAMPPISDQGDSSCVAHASLALFTWATIKQLDPTQIVDAADVQAWLTAGHPVAAGLLVFRSFTGDQALRSGVIPDPGRRDRYVDGHYLLIVGIGCGAEWIERGEFPTAHPTTRYVKVRNSWGADVYRAGHLLLSLDYLTRYSTERWTVDTANVG